jgi:hypothetical protein
MKGTIAATAKMDPVIAPTTFMSIVISSSCSFTRGRTLIPANLAVDRALDGWTSWRVFGSPDQFTSEHRRGSADALGAQRLLLRLVRGDETTNGATEPVNLFEAPSFGIY